MMEFHLWDVFSMFFSRFSGSREQIPPALLPVPGAGSDGHGQGQLLR